MKPRISESLLTWKEKQRLERYRARIKHYRMITTELVKLALVLTIGAMAVLTLYLYAL